MNISQQLINNFQKNKTCLFCNSKLETNKKQIILLMKFNPHYCNNCEIDYSDYNYGMLRINYKGFIFSIDNNGSLDVWANYNDQLYKKPFPEALDKQELFYNFNKIIKEYIFA